MELQEGYKLTELGVIPTDWDVKKLGDLATLRTGPFGSALHKSDYTVDGIPIINPMHINDGKLTPTRTMTVTDTAAKQLQEFLLRAGDIIIGRRGDMGRCAVVQEGQAGWLCGTGSLVVRPNAEVIPDFLQRVLSSPQIIARIEDASVGSTMINLNQKVLRVLNVQTPPIPEQQAIAKALCDIDLLVSSLDQIVTKKRNVKQGAMRQLLSGNKRLAGFTDKWAVKKLGDIFDFKNGLNKEKKYFGSGTPIVNYVDVYTKRGLIANDLKGRVTVTNAELKTYNVRKGDVFFTRTSETVEEIGLTSVILDDLRDTVFSGFILRARPKNNLLDTSYEKYCFSTHAIRKEITSKSSYTTRALTNGRLLSEVKISIPSLAEQKAIAQILNDIDVEIEQLEAQREKYRAVKQGMMQELLTGKTRLI